MSTFWKYFFKAQGTTLKFSTTYHPQIDGQTESLTSVLKRTYGVMLVINRDIGTPFFILLNIRTILAITLPLTHHHSKPSMVDLHQHFLISSWTHLSCLTLTLPCNTKNKSCTSYKKNIQRNKQSMLSQANKSCRDITFEEGDWVLLKLRLTDNPQWPAEPLKIWQRNFLGCFKFVGT